MPNLRQLIDLRERYNSLTPSYRDTKEYLDSLISLDALEKGFNSGKLIEGEPSKKLFSFLNESIKAKPDFITYFEEAREIEVTLLFIDITSFSTRIHGWSNQTIKAYLDSYYEEIIPIIYNCGGEIEKLMGDGIICVFGEPFLDKPITESVLQAEECAERAIKFFFGTDKAVKIAIHTGTIHYYKVPGHDYSEYTMIGQPITELYRLESISQPNRINFYSHSRYDYFGWGDSRFDGDSIIGEKNSIISLQGVNYTEIKSIGFQSYT